ncbi:TetR/AcrR family transcriptional regulator [Xanthomonas sp. 3058]|uniref:TetR/AcrR family transcriptional regulator n=1 Tax=Xanthomonas sp. 3058 TaxID=3035314 RepID=UPI001621FB3D|nr:TetR/AcrR family transcriptional regulator [Xanthomonas sp. 3058]MBB5866427.1 AcrR family transcriptional regulator [Xanthomonas sp. 3058]
MSSPPDGSPRRRLPREERTRQLLAKAWQLIGDEGTDALTLGRLADAAGVTKPVVYDHFGTRNGLLAALYQDYDARQTVLFDAAVEAAAATLQDKARVIATSYVNCVLTQGREISGVVAALTGSPELAAVKKQYQHAFIAKCAALLAPFCPSSGISSASLWAMLGAADALSDAAVTGDLSEAQAQHELQAIILGMVERSG